MRVISNKALVEFAAKHPDAGVPLQIWRKTIESGHFRCFADLKNSFNATDRVGKFHVFDIGGNKYRVIASVHFNSQKLYIRHIFTHQEYDRWTP